MSGISLNVLSRKKADQKQNFEKTFRWREDANENMATAMLDQVLYPVPGPFKSFVARGFASTVDWDSELILSSTGRIVDFLTFSHLLLPSVIFSSVRIHH